MWIIYQRSPEDLTPSNIKNLPIVEAVYHPEGKYHSSQQVRERLGKVITLAEDRKSGTFLSPTRGLVEYDVRTDTFTPVYRDDLNGRPVSVFPDPEIHTVRKSGTFLSPTRGLVEYDVRTDTFTPVYRDDLNGRPVSVFPDPEIHTVFGDVYLLLKFLENRGFISLFRSVFQKKAELERFLLHLLHGVLKDGSHISCDDFTEKSYASYLFRDIPAASLHSDTAFFTMMGSDHLKMKFFRELIAMMRKRNPAFGKGCYVDSTPLPNAISDNPFNALCCHGVSSSQIQTRLVLVLDEESGLPVWYDIIPGNVLDLSTVMNIMNDVAVSLDIEIESLVLDAGYVCRPLIEAFHIGSPKSLISRMPARKGYPFKELYWKVKSMIDKGKYRFVREGHTYFGKRENISLFSDFREFAYVYVDFDNALLRFREYLKGKYRFVREGHTYFGKRENISLFSDFREFAYVYVDFDNALLRFREYLLEHEDEYRQLKARDQDWLTVKYGYFVLISNIETPPEDLLSRYFCRTQIEGIFKTAKEYLQLLPLSKWTDVTVRGKILHDIINEIIFLELRRSMETTGISMNRLFGKTQSLMCFKNKDNIAIIEVPNKTVKQFYKLLDIEVPNRVDIQKHSELLLAPNG